MRWDLFIIILVVYNCIELPFNIAFFDLYDSLEETTIGYVIDVIFSLDIIITFRTGYTNSKTGLEVLIPKKIALKYLLSWRFVTDIVSIIPFELFMSKTNSAIKFFNMIKLIRLLRLGRIITFLKLK